MFQMGESRSPEVNLRLNFNCAGIHAKFAINVHMLVKNYQLSLTFSTFSLK